MTQKEKDIQLLKTCIKSKYADPFVNRYYKVIENTIRSMANRRNRWLEKEDIEDLRQIALIDMFKNDWKRLKKYDETRGMSVTSWVILLTHHAVWDYFGPPPDIPFGNGKTEDFADDQLNIEDQVLDKKQACQFFDNLQPLEKLAFKLKNFENVPVKDIAKIINCSESNVYKILEKINLKLYDIMESSI